jgi:uncharacterized membrane protein YgdD (TMEM256/DUF423 family)
MMLKDRGDVQSWGKNEVMRDHALSVSAITIFHMYCPLTSKLHGLWFVDGNVLLSGTLLTESFNEERATNNITLMGDMCNLSHF